MLSSRMDECGALSRLTHLPSQLSSLDLRQPLQVHAVPVQLPDQSQQVPGLGSGFMLSDETPRQVQEGLSNRLPLL